MKRIIGVIGPTAVGKSQLGIAIAKHVNGEIISCDAFQFYRGLNIGTAKLLENEWQGVKHHLIDILDPNDSFSVADYQKIVRAKIDELLEKNVTPVLVGGSGLYIQSVLYDYRFTGTKRIDDQELTKLANGELWQYLNQIAPEAAKNTDQNNRRRLMRAIEIALSDGDVVDQKGKFPFYDHFELIGLEMPRADLYARIEKRVDNMIESGLIEEVRGLYDAKVFSQSTQAIGYKELYQYFEGNKSLEETILMIKQQTRRYAKRQMTWFKNQMQAKWYTVNINDFQSTVNEILEDIKKNTD